MLATSMATKKPTAKKKPEGRKKSLLTEIGEEAMRRALLESLVKNDWSPSAVADALRMNGSANVLRAIKQLGLTEEYDKARLGMKPGKRPAS